MTAHNTLKRVRTATAMGTAKVTRLCARTQQHQEVCGPAGQGERALRATHTPAAAQVHRLCAQPPHHVDGPRASSEECAERAHHTDSHIQTTGLLPISLANSPIDIVQLEKILNEYASINSVVAEELRSGFKEGFKLGYLGPRVLQKS